MTWTSMAWQDLLASPPTEAEDTRFHLSLHTEVTPSDTNELDPATHPGYTRVQCASSIAGDRGGSPALSTVEWQMVVGTAAATTNTQAWPSPFANKGDTAWPAAKSCGLNVGPDAAVARSAVSKRVSTLVLGQDFVLAAGQSGLPPDNIRDFSIAKPSPFSAGGLYGGLQHGDHVPNGFNGTPYGYTFNSLLEARHSVREAGPSVAAAQVTPAERAQYGNGIAQIPFRLVFFTDAMLPESNGQKTGGLPTGEIAGFGVNEYDDMWPIMALSTDGTKLENKNEMALSVTAPVTGAAYWGLYDASAVWNRNGREWRTRQGRQHPYIRSANPSSFRTYLTFYGPVDQTSPALAVGEGVIPAGAISITL